MTPPKRAPRQKLKEAEDMGLASEVGELRGDTKALKERMDRADASLILELAKVNAHLQRQDEGTLQVSRDTNAKFDALNASQQEIKDILIAYGSEKKIVYRMLVALGSILLAATTFFSGAWSFLLGKH